MALSSNSYSAISYLRLMSLIFERWRWRPILLLPLSSSYYFLSFLSTFHLRHSEDGTDSTIFILSLSFFYYLLSSFIFALQNLINAHKKRLKYRKIVSWQKKKKRKHFQLEYNFNDKMFSFFIKFSWNR